MFPSEVRAFQPQLAGVADTEHMQPMQPVRGTFTCPETS
jgi:hypothetical protein